MSSREFLSGSTDRQPSELDGLCSSCNAGCCQRGTYLPLSRKEHDFMVGKFGACYEGSFESAPVVDRTPNSRRWLILKDDCPALNLGTLACNMHDNPSRPAVCGAFESGSEACLGIREERLSGVPAIRFSNRRRLALPIEPNEA